jgi:uncharacterized protein
MRMQAIDHLLAALLQGDEKKVLTMMRHEPDLRTTRNMFGVSPLHAAHFVRRDLLVLLAGDATDFFVAAELGDLPVLDRALAANPSLALAFAAGGSTALHGACYWGQLDAARLPLDAGADPSARSRDSFLEISPLGSAIATTPGITQPSDDEEVVLALVRLLLEGGAAPDQPRRDGMTPLHSAAWRGLGRVAQELLDAGADPAATAKAGAHTGQTPADTALAQGHLILAARLDSGAIEVANPYQ